MKTSKLTSILLACTFLCWQSHAQTAKTPAQLQSDINSKIRANAAGAITGPILNTILLDITASFISSLSSGTWPNVQTYLQNPIFSNCTGYLIGNGASQASCTQVSSADHQIYLSTAGNDTNNGLNPDRPKRTLQAAIDAVGSNGNVSVGAGSYTLADPIYMRPGVHLLCNPGATITQANGANLTGVIDFTAYAAAGGGIENCTLDGNRSNNSDNFNTKFVIIGNQSDVTIKGNTIQNQTGVGVYVSSGMNDNIVDNKFDNVYGTAIFIVSPTAGTSTYTKVERNRFSRLGWGAVGLGNTDHNVIRGNIINGDLIGPPTDPLQVNISGTSVTWVSGPKFDNARAGEWLVALGGGEFNIASVVSNTVLTLATSAGTASNTPATIQPVDFIGLQNSAFNQIVDNYLSGGGNYGVSIASDYSTGTTQNNLVANNEIIGQGKNCISLNWVTGAGQIKDNFIVGNHLVNCGLSGAALAADAELDGNAIAVVTSAPGHILNTFVDGNYITDTQATPTTQRWLYVSPTSSTGAVVVGNNTQFGVANSGVGNGVASVSLGAGWGSTASVSAITSYGNSVSFTITAGGTGIAANPYFTVNTAASKPSQGSNVVYFCKMSGGSGTIQHITGESLSTPTYIFGTYNGTPASGATYVFICQ